MLWDDVLGKETKVGAAGSRVGDARGLAYLWSQETVGLRFFQKRDESEKR